jgi:hypothetical protein
MIECGKIKIKFIVREFSDTRGVDINVSNTLTSQSIFGFINFLEDNDDLYILKTWGDLSGSLSQLNIDFHHLNRYDRVKIVGVDLHER